MSGFDLGNFQTLGFLGAAYPWVKAAHVTFVIFWIAGLFIVPRYYIHHQATTPGSAEDRAWIEREDRARTIILAPAMLIVWALGLMLAVHLGAFGQAWFSAKLALVVLLTAYQGWIGAYGKKLAAGQRDLEDKKLRLMNEVPGILTALIVVLVIVRPF
ncbi:CopD family protein [Sphingomonas sp.]|uniref:CopD family protein n=1 Tax=Sphingomonas sp. TaxID=28214 RepID=UPI00286DF681|nr:CopD family protein [Sphingomonas sp.]